MGGKITLLHRIHNRLSICWTDQKIKTFIFGFFWFMVRVRLENSNLKSFLFKKRVNESSYKRWIINTINFKHFLKCFWRNFIKNLICKKNHSSSFIHNENLTVETIIMRLLWCFFHWNWNILFEDKNCLSRLLFY